MTKEELYQYLQNPDSLTKENLATLEQLVNAYPYAGGLTFLYLFGLHHTQDIRFPSELRRLAVRLPSRGLLYAIAEQDTPYRPVVLSKEHDSEGFSLVEQFLEEQCFPTEQTLPSSKEIAISEDYFATIGVSDDETSAHTSEKASTFTLSPSKDEVLSSVETGYKPIDKEEWSDTLFTETLGRIYAKQKRFDKALAVFEAIEAKNSEKSAFFAEQIEYLQLLIENKQEEQSQ